MNAQMIHTSLLRCNEGQLEGLPSNPRYIKDEKFELLKRSLQESPEMLHLRELLVYPHGDTYIVIGGNMRLRAAEELGIEELPCKVLPATTPVEKLREYTIKDNNGYGEYDWDILANEWDEMPLADWGVDMPAFEEMADGGEKTASDGGDKESNGGGLCARFVVPPFSTLDTRQGYWQDRKKMWRASSFFTPNKKNYGKRTEPHTIQQTK